MRSRVFNIKKSTILLCSAILNSILFVVGSVFSVLIFKQYNAWFFLFCLNVGLHLIIKSLLFKYDSSCYFGTILFLLGIFYIFCISIDLYYFYPVFVLIAFATASLFTFYFYKQPYHIFLALSLLFVTIALLFFLLNKISIWIFLAIVGVSVLLLIVRYFTLK